MAYSCAAMETTRARRRRAGIDWLFHVDDDELIHFGAPWVKVEFLITKQSVVFNMPVKGCKTSDNVTVQINLAVVFRVMCDAEKGEDPMMARHFVYRVTPRGLEQQLMDACEEATRSVARSLQHLEVYGLRTDRSGKGAKVIKGAGDAEAPPLTSPE